MSNIITGYARFSRDWNVFVNLVHNSIWQTSLLYVPANFEPLSKQYKVLCCGKCTDFQHPIEIIINAMCLHIWIRTAELYSLSFLLLCINQFDGVWKHQMMMIPWAFSLITGNHKHQFNLGSPVACLIPKLCLLSQNFNRLTVKEEELHPSILINLQLNSDVTFGFCT
jgi:hypothetical protein